MDHIVDLIVRLISALSRTDTVIPGRACATWQPGNPIKVLLAGYNGARNTGSDVRVAAIADQLIDLFGEENVHISVMSLDVESTAPYFGENVQQVPFKTLFFGKLHEAISQNHVIILCEGSTLKSMFANALTLYNCEAAGVAAAQGKPCIAYGAEIGRMDGYIARTAADLCARTHFVVRSASSFEEAHKLGLNAHLGTDTAWRFDSSRGSEKARRLLREGGWDGETPLLGIAAVDPFCWPVTPSIRKWLRAVACKERTLQYQSWYFFSQSEERERKLDAYLDGLAQSALTFCAERGFAPVIIGMEKLDARACEELGRRLGGKVPLILSRDHDGYAISEILRSLSLLVTTRYHAQVLATDALVPTVAVSMDERLDNLSQELGTPSDLLLHVDDADLGPRILVALDYAQDNRARIQAQLATSREALQQKFDAMGAWLKSQIYEELSARSE